VLLEPPRADLRHRQLAHSSLSPLRAGLASAAALMAATSVGDVLLLGVVLAVVAADVVTGAGVVLAATSVLVRWGSSSLGALAGNQAVLGGAGWSGSIPGAASAWCAAAALVAATPPGVLPAAGFGLAAANVVAGPGLGGAVVVRIAASAAGVGAAWLVGRFAAQRWTRGAAAVGGALAVVLAAAR
jgi:hypothetical protein